MRIERVSGVVYRQPIEHGSGAFEPQAVERRWKETLLVRVDTDNGLTGWGEAFADRGVAAATLSALETVVAPRCIGLDVSDPMAISQSLSRTLHALGGGPVMYALSGVDIALWDVCGKARGEPVHQMLGGALTRSLVAYASLVRHASAPAVAADCKAAIALGYAGVKLDAIGSAEVQAAADVVGAVPLMLDLNCPWRLDQASDFLLGLKRIPLHWVEEPIWPPENYRALATLRERVGLPMAAGENAMTVGDFSRMLAMQAVDFAQPSVTKIGGLSPASRLAALAATAGVALAPHSPYVGPGLCATLHLCAAKAPEAMIEHLFLDMGLGPFGDRLRPHAGRFVVPDGPGLGMDPDPAWLAQHAMEARSAS